MVALASLKMSLTSNFFKVWDWSLGSSNTSINSSGKAFCCAFCLFETSIIRASQAFKSSMMPFSQWTVWQTHWQIVGQPHNVFYTPFWCLPSVQTPLVCNIPYNIADSAGFWMLQCLQTYSMLQNNMLQVRWISKYFAYCNSLANLASEFRYTRGTACLKQSSSYIYYFLLYIYSTRSPGWWLFQTSRSTCIYTCTCIYLNAEANASKLRETCNVH